MKLDLIAWYKIFLDLQEKGKDLETLEEISLNIDSLSAVAGLGDLDRLQFASDDTTMIYTNELVGACRLLETDLVALCDEFLGISSEVRQRVLKHLPTLLVSYSLLLYKQFGYEVLAADYTKNKNIDPSRVILSERVLEDIAEDMSRAVDTLRLILVIFQTFNAYFAEYQVSTDEDLADIVGALEDAGLGTEAIATVSEEQVKKILGLK